MVPSKQATTVLMEVIREVVTRIKAAAAVNHSLSGRERERESGAIARIEAIAVPFRQSSCPNRDHQWLWLNPDCGPDHGPCDSQRVFELTTLET
ncbi:hypothetical protein CRG98_002374 [Punica granatum]|uniref:Uncharacterized protein n=1 Tax=Punica granatum TaxID=22663 RepID=A0A2I0L9B6_PUNGR|nr:hypothetical protein CRG98_002374 [Punica granatum]